MKNEIYDLFLTKKAENESKLILIKNGDHFETFDSDAEIISNELNYAITQLDIDGGNTVAQTSVPEKELENVLKSLTEVSIETVDNNKKRYVVLVVLENAEGKRYEYFVPVTAADSAVEDTSTNLKIEEVTEEAKSDEAALPQNEVKAGADKTLRVPTYEELKQSELYMPIVDLGALSDGEISRAAQNKLSGEMDIRTFLYSWLHFTFRTNLEFAKQFLVKSKSLSKGIDYIQDKLKAASKTSGSVGIGESKVIELFLTYLRLDDALIAAQKAKEEADRKARAAEKAKKAKNKTNNKMSAKAADPAKAKPSEKKDASTGKRTTRRSSAPKAATDDSVLSLFSMM